MIEITGTAVFAAAGALGGLGCGDAGRSGVVYSTFPMTVPVEVPGMPAGATGAPVSADLSGGTTTGWVLKLVMLRSLECCVSLSDCEVV